MAVRSSQFKECATLFLAGIGAAACVAELWKHLVIRRSFPGLKPAPRRSSVSVLQPVTAGTIGLQARLKSRVGDEFIVAGDDADIETRGIADQAFSKEANYRYISLPRAADGGPAVKTTKLRSALEAAAGDVVLFVDDDICLPPEAADVAARVLQDPRNGAVFGVPYSVLYEGFWSAMMSAFVNRYAFPSYFPLAHLIPVYSVTGHWYAVRRSDMLAVAGYAFDENRIDDDHALARELRARGFNLVQVALVHGVENQIPNARAFHRQMKRWFVFVREMMTPHLSRQERLVSGLLGLPESVLPALVIGAVALRSRGLGAFAALLVASGIGHSHFAARNAGRRLPFLGLLLAPVVSLLSPIYIAGILLLANNRIWWRGREFEVRRDGKVKL